MEGGCREGRRSRRMGGSECESGGRECTTCGVLCKVGIVFLHPSKRFLDSP